MSNKQSLVSIGMPVYNSERHLRRALDSVLAQDYPHFEVIISDNGSIDGSEEICREYEASDKRIRYYRNDRNMGMAWNVNRLLDLASGEYFKWAGSHDFIAPSFISACKAFLDENSQVVLAYSLARAINDQGEVMREIAPETIDTRGLPASLRVYVIIAKAENSAVINYGLYRTSALRRCRPVTAVIGNDQVTLTEISILGAIALVPEVLFFRGYFGPTLTEHERMAKDLIRLNPEAINRDKARPIWELWMKTISRTWRIASPRQKLYLVPVVAYAFYSRWHKQLKEELRSPYCLRQYAAPDY